MRFIDTDGKERHKGWIYCIENDIHTVDGVCVKDYIGQTTRSVLLRFKEHCKQNERSGIDGAIGKYGKEHFWPVTVCEVVKDTNDELQDELNELEQYYIRLFDSYHHGYNQNYGGDGQSGYTGKRGEENANSKPIIQFSLEGEKIAEFPGARDAARSIGVSYGMISNCCNGKNRIGSGYLWMFKEDWENGKKPIVKRRPLYNQREVVQLDMECNLVCVYESITDAQQKTGINHIGRACQGKSQKIGGYMWMYKEDWDKGERKKYVKYSTKGIPNLNLRGDKNNRSKKIVQLDKDGSFVRVWNCISDVKRECGYEPSAICLACKDYSKTRYGFRWMYKDEYDKQKKESDAA